jgi:hypothetical protein
MSQIYFDNLLTYYHAIYFEGFKTHTVMGDLCGKIILGQELILLLLQRSEALRPLDLLGAGL